jgi:hypothetical protein
MAVMDGVRSGSCCSSRSCDDSSATAVVTSGGSPVRATTGRLTARNSWDHIAARWGVNRSGHSVDPGLYALGSPDRSSPVFVTANYTLSFDALRSAVDGLDCHILVLDTRGVNVWCAAGKGTFGTEELVGRIVAVDLANVVDHRTLILPQLAATGVAGREVRRRSGFDVEFGPVRADDLPAYIETGSADRAMRTVRFGIGDRLALVPMEFVHALVPMVVTSVALYVAAGWLAAWAAIAAFASGTVLFPLLLPWLPTPDFTTKGLALGAVVAAPFAAARLTGVAEQSVWWNVGWAAVHLLAMPPVTAFLSLLFTGSTTFTSKSGVEKEIARYTRPLAGFFAAGTVLAILLIVLGLRGSA